MPIPLTNIHTFYALPIVPAAPTEHSVSSPRNSRVILRADKGGYIFYATVH